MSELKPAALDDDLALSNQETPISEDDQKEDDALSDMESVTGSERDAVSEAGSETPSISDRSSSQRLSRSASNTPTNNTTTNTNTNNTNTRSTRSQNNPKFVAKQKSFMAKIQAATSGVDVGGMGRPETPGKRKREGSSAPANAPSATKKRRSGKTDNNGQDYQNDNYCWECHREGVFICCEMCPRVFHLKCAGMEREPEEDWACSECHAVMQAENIENRSRSMQLISVEQLCTLLKYALNRLQNMPGMEPFTKPVDVSEFPTYEDIVVHPVDFTSLERNIRRKFYGSTEAFSSDARWIVHNSVIFNGANSKVSSMARSLVKILKQEMSEIETCPDCYMNAHQNPRSWFTEVCRSAHPLIWARLKGFPFWPAKAVKWKDGNVDVRFFGRHDRSWVPIKECFLFSEQMPTPLKNRNKTLESCLQEVNEHISKLREKFGTFKYAPHRVQFNPLDQDQIKIMLPSYKGPVPFRVRPHSRAFSRLSAHSDDETSSIASTDSGTGHRRRRRESGTSTATQGTETETEIAARESDIEDTDRTLEIGLRDSGRTNLDSKGIYPGVNKNRDDNIDIKRNIKVTEDVEMSDLKDHEDEDMEDDETEDCGKYPGQVNSEDELEDDDLDDPSLMNGKSLEVKRAEAASDDNEASDTSETKSEKEREPEKLRELEKTSELPVHRESELLKERLLHRPTERDSQKERELEKEKDLQREMNLKIENNLDKNLEKFRYLEKAFGLAEHSDLEKAKGLEKDADLKETKRDLEKERESEKHHKSNSNKVSELVKDGESEKVVKSERDRVSEKDTDSEDEGDTEKGYLSDYEEMEAAERREKEVNTLDLLSRISKTENEDIEDKEEEKLSNEEKDQREEKDKYMNDKQKDREMKEEEGGKEERDKEIKEEERDKQIKEEEEEEKEEEEEDLGPLQLSASDLGSLPHSTEDELALNLSTEDEKEENKLTLGFSNDDEKEVKKLSFGFNNEDDKTDSGDKISLGFSNDNTKDDKLTLGFSNDNEKDNKMAIGTDEDLNPFNRIGVLADRKVPDLKHLTDRKLSYAGQSLDPKHPDSTNKSESDNLPDRLELNNDEDMSDSDNVSESNLDTKDSLTDDEEGEDNRVEDEEMDEEEEKIKRTDPSVKERGDKIEPMDAEDMLSESDKLPEIGFKTGETDDDDDDDSESEDERSNDERKLEITSRLDEIASKESVDNERLDERTESEKESVIRKLAMHCDQTAESDSDTDERENQENERLKIKLQESVTFRSIQFPSREEEMDKDDERNTPDESKKAVEKDHRQKSSRETEKEEERMEVDNIKKEETYEREERIEKPVSKEDDDSMDNQKDDSRSSLFDAVQLMKNMGTIAITRIDGKSLGDTGSSSGDSISVTRKDPPKPEEGKDERKESKSAIKSTATVTVTSSQRHSPPTKVSESSKDMEQHISSLGCSVSVTKAVEKEKEKDKFKELKEKVKMPSGVDTTRLSPSISIIPMSGGSDRHKMKTTVAPSAPSVSTSVRLTPGASSPSQAPTPPTAPRVSSSHAIPPPPPLSHPQAPPSSVGSRGVFGPPPPGSQVVGIAGGRGIISSPGMRMVSSSGMMMPPRVSAGPPPRHLPPEAGPLAAQLHKHSQKLAEVMRATLEDVLGGLVMTGTPEARVAALQLELERTNWRHQQELAEVRHNADVMLVEMRANLEAEKQHAVEDIKRQTEQQLIEGRRQFERQMVERLTEVRRQMEAEKQRAVEETKRKQWCANCGKEALFFCCWNTSYCDYPCQQSHWPQHMSVCGQNSDGGGGGGGGEGGGGDSINGEASAHSSRVSTPVQNIIGGQYVDDDGSLALAEEHRRRKLREDAAESVTSSILAQCLIKGNRDRPKKKSKKLHHLLHSGSSRDKEHMYGEKEHLEQIDMEPPESLSDFSKNPSKSPKAWMDWFLEQSGAEGIKENLQVAPKPSKAKARKSMGGSGGGGGGGKQPPEGGRKKRKSTPCVRRKIEHILKPEEVTEEMLYRVATKPKEKAHDQENGTSCHQCRQKTADTKTICRSGRCVGLRGFFCGPCLRTRYGEDARKALLDPDWSCPVCRGVCNCSLCRKAFGQQAVGQIVQRLGKMGYSSVQQYLDAKGGQEEKVDLEKEKEDKDEEDSQEADELKEEQVDFKDEEESLLETGT